MSMSACWTDAEVIHVYTRAQALADGVLVDVSPLAREAGFKLQEDSATSLVLQLHHSVPQVLGVRFGGPALVL